MIHHCNDDLQKLSFLLKPSLRYSEGFTFIPFRLKPNHEFLVQTPKVFVPFGIQENMNSKDYIMISFQNKDKGTLQFMDNLQYIIDIITSHFKGTYTVNSFLKDYKGEPCMNIKVRDNAPIFTTMKERCECLPIYSYASFIIHLAGLWVANDQVWFQWYALQSRLENAVSLPNYAFKDEKPKIPPPPPLPPPPKTKYDRMMSLGVPTIAIQHQMKIDSVKEKPTISASMLQSVTLKKGQPKPLSKLPTTDIDGFEPPSLDDLQRALQKLRKSIR